MELFFDLIFKPKEALSRASSVSLLLLPVIWLLMIPYYFSFFGGLGTPDGIRFMILILLGIAGYILGMTAIYSISIDFSKRFFYALVLSYFPYIFVFPFVFVKGILPWVFLVLGCWSVFLESLTVRGGGVKRKKVFLFFVPVKLLRILFFLWVIY